jgi:hypothetical protein
VNRYPEEVLGPDEDDGTMPNNVAKLAEAVVGHRIVSVERGERTSKYDYWASNQAVVLTLDDGRRVELADTSDCCASTELTSFLINPEAVDHVITGVGTTNGYSTWHIFADYGDILQLNVDWHPGNPFYYGYGLSITVKNVD